MSAAALFAVLVPSRLAHATPASWCNDYAFTHYVPSNGTRCPFDNSEVYTAYCDGRMEFWSCSSLIPASFCIQNPTLIYCSLAAGCDYVKSVLGAPPSETCGTACIDEDCDGCDNEGCPDICDSACVDENCNGIRNEGCPEICDSACVDENCNGIRNEGCEVLNGTDDNCNGLIDEGLAPPDPPDPAAPPVQAETDPIKQMNDGCSNGDWAGWDPVQLATRAAATLPFTDFEVTPLRSLSMTRSYSSADASSGSSNAGFFGTGWHHNWETTLTCSNNGASCTVEGGLGQTMRFAADSGTVVGVGAQVGESLTLYRRTESAALVVGAENLMIRRPNGEFILFQVDGSELHFTPPLSSGCAYCMDASFNGKLHLTRDVDTIGRAVQLEFGVLGKLIALTDDLGNMLSLEPSLVCSGLAGALKYRAGTDGVDSTYVTYEYDAACRLERVVPANYVAAPGKTAQLRAYGYQATATPGTPGLLTTVWNEFNDPVVVFGYETASGDVTSLLDDGSSLTISYPQPTQDSVVSAYGSGSSTDVRYRGSAGKAFSVSTSSPADSVTGTSKLDWNGRYLLCTEDEQGRVRHFERDVHNRVTLVADYGSSSCAATPWATWGATPLRAVHYEYSLSKQVAQGVTLSLGVMTKQYQKSVFAAELATAAGSGTSPETFKTSETFDYDPTWKSGDPAGYSCGTSLPVGGLVCRRIVEGYTKVDTGLPTLQRLATFYSYDARGRLVRTVGPIYLAGQAPAVNVDPVEERTYWPDLDPDPARRGRLHEIKRWPSGWPDATKALTTSFELYDAFGPTQVIDPTGGTTVLTRVGGAGRVTRVDGPDGRHVGTRYYDGGKPRLILLNGGSTRRFTYDARGRLSTIAPLSGDPEVTTAIVTVGWLESRLYDAAGNPTLVIRADSVTTANPQGVVRWEERFSHYANGEIKDITHPEPGQGYARWKRDKTGVPEQLWDEDNRVINFLPDGLKRVSGVQFGSATLPRDFVHWSVAPGQFSYEYEAGQDALRAVNSRDLASSPLRTIASYVHDDFGRLLSVNSSTMKMGPYAYAYDARGNVVQRSGGGAVIRYQYDGLDRLTRLTATRNADLSSFEYVYAYDDPSARGRLHSITEPDRTTTFTYDQVGRIRFEIVAEADTTTMLTTEYRYDADGDLGEVITPAGLDVKYERDRATKDVTEVRNVTSGTWYASNAKHLPGGPVTYLMRPNGDTLDQRFNLRYEPIYIDALSYTMTPAGHVKTMGPTTYDYDAHGRLVSATPSTGATPYRYTIVDDRVTEAWTIEASPKRRFAFGYDDGSSLSAISTYDAAGTTITGTTCLVHDALGRLTAVGPALAAAGPDATACRSEGDLSSVTVRFRYDARNRRVGRQDGTGPWKQWAFTADGNPVTEMWKPTSSGGTWTIEREYVWMEGKPLVQLEYPGPSGGSEGYVYSVHVDHLGQPWALKSMSGTIVWLAVPSRPYGELAEVTAPDPANGRTVRTNLRLPGQYDERLLASIGIQGPYYNYNRWYLPSMGRYLELDPIALRGGLNGAYAPDWYGYAEGNPLRWTDPNGEIAGFVLGGLFGAAYGALGAVITRGDWRAGLVTGMIVGGAIGALVDPTTSVIAMAAIGGLGSGLGAVAGAMADRKPVPWGGVTGATLGGAAGGAFQGALGASAAASGLMTGASEWGVVALGEAVGGASAFLGELQGEALGNALTGPEPIGRALPGWGCK